MINNTDIIVRLSRMTQIEKLKWYITHTDGSDIQYASVYNITGKKWLIFKLYCKPYLNEFYLIIRLSVTTKNGIVTVPVSTLTSENYEYGKYIDILYHSVKYSSPKKIIRGGYVFNKIMQ